MKLISRVDIDPILFPKNISKEEKHNRILQLSKIHALNYLESNTNITITSKTFQPNIRQSFGSLHVVEMRVGKPMYPTFMLLDTGSDDTWLQCDGCIQPNCFPIINGNYKYLKSQTMKGVSCNDPLCVPKRCSPTGNKCLYSIEYEGGASSKGLVLSETFTFPNPNDKNNPLVSFNGVVFGCGLINKNIVFGKNKENKISGIFGIGTGPRSFLSQLSAETKMRLSYCLSSQPPSYLHFGNDAKIRGNFKTTQLLTKIGDVKLTKYYVVCTGISLSGTMLAIDPKLFELKSGETGGFVFDSGSDVTFLVEGAFNVLKKNVIDYFEKNHKLNPFTGHNTGFELCYHNVPNNVVKPWIVYHFKGGADFKVDSNKLFLSIDEKKLLCLTVGTMKDEKVPNILGARHQSDHDVLFDVEKNEVSFSPMPHTCT
ncbi:aspartic proteinase CDR1 [Trifolium repens]|nr:aspartic proteinase CDR1 [Trifolium repens]